MRLQPYLVALAAVLALHPGRAQAQTPASPAEQGIRKSTGMGPGSGRRAAAPLGFSFGMTPGQGNAYGYPYVTRVTKGLSAERAGLAVGDTILSINGRDARQGRMFPETQPGTRYLLRVRRGGEERELTYVFPAPAAPATR